MFSMVYLACKGWCIGRRGGRRHIPPHIKVHYPSVLFMTTFLTRYRQLCMLLSVFVQRQLLSWSRLWWRRLSGLKVGRLRWRLMLAHRIPASSFVFLFDRAEVNCFFSPVYWCMLKQRGSGGLQRQWGLLEGDVEGFLFYTAGVPCYALVALGPLTVATWIVCASQAVQRQGCSEGAASFGKTWVGGESWERRLTIWQHGGPRKGVVWQLRALRLGLLGSLCCLKSRQICNPV